MAIDSTKLQMDCRGHELDINLFVLMNEAMKTEEAMPSSIVHNVGHSVSKFTPMGSDSMDTSEMCI